MIVGVMLRHYKNYENINFLPISDDIEHKYAVYVGNNGVGKSGILESLDVVLNGREWNYTSGAKKMEAYICPIFLIERNNKSNKEMYDFLGDYFWKVEKTANPNLNSPPFPSFFTYRDNLKEKYEKTHWIILIGSQINSKNAYFSTFNSDLTKKIATSFKLNDDEMDDKLSEIKDEIYAKYNYLYIPVEQSLNELLRLENKEMQMLLNKNLLDEIEQILTKKETSLGLTIVKQINDSLDGFIEQVNNAISAIDNSYSFASDGTYKKSLTAKDIREKILEAYFPLKVLKHNGKKIKQLSSGEQRKALIDVAYSTLVANGKNDTEREIILAIDEPETSMHISNCFKQFMLLEDLSEKFGKQVILTTHWYGFLPISQYGKMHHISRENETADVLSFDFSNYLEDRRKYPDVIELKSLFDLATSILTYMRNEPEVQWIVCEGSDDKIYLECILEDESKIKILPVGGCGNVVKLYQLLCTPMSEKEEAKVINGKILFLIDTDFQFKQVNKPLRLSKNDYSILIRRIQLDNENIKLIDPTIQNNPYAQTEIEDCLIPKVYYESLKEVINAVGNENEKTIMSKFQFIDGVKTSQLRGDKSCITHTDLKYFDKKDIILNFAEEGANKYLIAKKYVEKYKDSYSAMEHKFKNVILECLSMKVQDNCSVEQRDC